MNILYFSTIPSFTKANLGDPYYPSQSLLAEINAVITHTFLTSNAMRSSNTLVLALLPHVRPQNLTPSFLQRVPLLLLSIWGKKVRYLAPDYRNSTSLLRKAVYQYYNSFNRTFSSRHPPSQVTWKQTSPGIRYTILPSLDFLVSHLPRLFPDSPSSTLYRYVIGFPSSVSLLTQFPLPLPFDSPLPPSVAEFTVLLLSHLSSLASSSSFDPTISSSASSSPSSLFDQFLQFLSTSPHLTSQLKHQLHQLSLSTLSSIDEHSFSNVCYMFFSSELVFPLFSLFFSSSASSSSFSPSPPLSFSRIFTSPSALFLPFPSQWKTADVLLWFQYLLDFILSP